MEIKPRSTARASISQISPYVFGAIRKFENPPKCLKTKTETKNEFRDATNTASASFSKKTIYKYDKKGNIIEEHSINAMGETEISYRYTYVYDDKLNKIEQQKKDSHGNVIWRVTSKYDQRNNVIEEFDYFADALKRRHVYKYDDKSNMLEWTSYKADGKLDGKNVYEYDGNGRLTEKARYNVEGKLEWRHQYKYDDGGKVKQTLACHVLGAIVGKDIYKYNNENLIEETFFEIKQGKEIAKEQTLYEYTFY